MAGKRKTLPADLQEIIDSGDMAAFAAVFDKCEIGATNRGKTTANVFSYRGLTLDHVKFLVENGIDLNVDSGFGRTPSAYLADDMEILKFIIEHGADIEHEITHEYPGMTDSHGTALFVCASLLRVRAVENLLACGAYPDPAAGGHVKYTSLENALSRCGNIDIPRMVRIACILIDAGAKITDRAKELVTSIGEKFEFYRDCFDPDTVGEHSAALGELYELFDVEPVPRRVKYDGKTPIVVKSETWQEQYSELWDMLVPGSGHANTVQGELIRIAGRVTFELLDNGGINWDEEYRKMLKAMPVYFGMSDKADAALTEEACALAKKISSRSGEAELCRLAELTVGWIVSNPEPIALESVDYNR